MSLNETRPTRSRLTKTIKIMCNGCGKALSETDTYLYNGKPMCEDCAIDEGLFPLGHTGSRRDKISERGRHLHIPES